MTLLELLVAIAMFSIIAAAGYLALQQGLGTASQLKNHQQYWQRLESVVNLVEMDLKHAINRPPRISGFSPVPSFEGARDSARAPQGEFLRFTRGGHVGFSTQPESPYLRVGYQLEDGALYRMTWPRLDGPYGMEPRLNLLLKDVESVRLRYLQGRKNWIQSWNISDGRSLDGLPGAVELELTLNNEKRFTRLFHVGHVY